MSPGYVLVVLGAMAGITFVLRALPFVAGQWLKDHPFVQRLGDFLPLGIMVLLVLHAGWGAALADPHRPWPELAAIAFTVAVQWWGRHPLVSILGGTALYLVWRNGLF